MITAEEAYQRFILKTQTSADRNISTDRGSFAIKYNEYKNRLVKWYLNNRNTAQLEDIQVLLEGDFELIPGGRNLDHYSAELPKNFLSSSFARAKASKGECKNKEIDLFEIRDENRAHINNSELFGASFDYREAPYVFSGNNIKIFVEEGMKIERVYLTYYKYPNKIRLEDPEDPESHFDNNYKIEFGDEVLDRIISGISGEIKIDNEDPAYQLDKQREKENLRQI